MVQMNMKWGVDLGGTKIECVALADDGKILQRERVPTESAKGYKHVLGQIERLVGGVSKKVGQRPQTLGVGTPGFMDPVDGLLKNCNALALNGENIEMDLKETLQIPVNMANDANCFALAEYHQGIVSKEYKDAKVVFGITLGTGVGGGLIVDGKVHRGRNNLGGEWGHSVLDPNGRDCFCGKKGCVETFISGTALELDYLQKSSELMSLKEVYERYEKGNNLAAQVTIENLLHYFGLAIANVINTIDPDVIVIGGGVSNLPVLYDLGIEEINKHVFGKKCQTPILKAELGDSAGVFGAAYLTA